MWNITHSGTLGLKELEQAGNVVEAAVDPQANIIYGSVVDPTMGDQVSMTVIAAGFPPKAFVMEDPEEVRRIADYGLHGVTSVEDAELPAFLRRNIRSLNAIRAERESGVVARVAERR
ncbi:hypothetical protein J0H33_06270 [bacterium]|nr:hypothetical protein [bacterium]